MREGGNFACKIIIIQSGSGQGEETNDKFLKLFKHLNGYLII